MRPSLLGGLEAGTFPPGSIPVLCCCLTQGLDLVLDPPWVPCPTRQGTLTLSSPMLGVACQTSVPWRWPCINWGTGPSGCAWTAETWPSSPRRSAECSEPAVLSEFLTKPGLAATGPWLPHLGHPAPHPARAGALVAQEGAASRDMGLPKPCAPSLAHSPAPRQLPGALV